MKSHAGSGELHRFGVRRRAVDLGEGGPFRDKPGKSCLQILKCCLGAEEMRTVLRVVQRKDFPTVIAA